MGTGLRGGVGMLVMTLVMAVVAVIVMVVMVVVVVAMAVVVTLVMALVATLVTMVGVSSVIPLIPSFEKQADVHRADRAWGADNLERLDLTQSESAKRRNDERRPVEAKSLHGFPQPRAALARPARPSPSDGNRFQPCAQIRRRALLVFVQLLASYMRRV
jgi:hypothetical protein